MTNQCVPAQTGCTQADCGPRPGIPTWMCDNGQVGGFTGACIPSPNSLQRCVWEIIDCPRSCTPQECGPQPAQPNRICPNSMTIAGPTGRCLRDAMGTCGWEIISCP
jgi:hypothetical protein